MEKLLSKLGLPLLLSAILSGHNLKDLVNSVLKQFGLTDVLGFAVEYAITTYRTSGRASVIRMATIKESSLRDWAKRFNANGDEVVLKGRAFATAFADFVEAFFPRTVRQ